MVAVINSSSWYFMLISMLPRLLQKRCINRFTWRLDDGKWVFTPRWLISLQAKVIFPWFDPALSILSTRKLQKQGGLDGVSAVCRGKFLQAASFRRSKSMYWFYSGEISVSHFVLLLQSPWLICVSPVDGRDKKNIYLVIAALDEIFRGFDLWWYSTYTLWS